MRLLFATSFFFFSFSSLAIMDPRCVGVARPADYDENKQRSFLQNYFAASFMLTPLTPIAPYDGPKVGVGLELSLVPGLSCEQRFVFDATKTEDTNKMPIFPRPRLVVQFPDFGPFAIAAGLSIIPPH